jgi:hypothetical protein
MTRRRGASAARAGGTVSILLAVFAALWVAGPVSAGAATNPQLAATAPRLLVDAMDRQIPAEGTVTITGRVQPAHAGDVVSLSIGGPLGSRAALHAQRDGTGNSRTAAGEATHTDKTGRFTLRVATNDLPLQGAGVYPIDLSARTSAGSDGSGPLASLTTFLPYFPGGVADPAELGVVLPVTDQPRQVDAGTLMDTGLADETAPGGRLNRLVPTGSGAGLTLAVDPALLTELSLTGSGTWRVVSAKHPVQGVDPHALPLLDRIRTLAAQTPAIVLPQADVDASGLVLAGYASQLTAAVRAGTATAADLDITGSARLAVPAGGCAGTSTLSALKAAGAAGIVVDEACAALDPALTYTQSAHTRVIVNGRPTDLLVSDAELQRLIAAGPTGAATPRLAEQLVLAETAMIVLEQPYVARQLLVALPRDWNPSAGWLASLLQQFRSVPWLTPVSAASLLDRTEVARGALALTDTGPLPIPYLDRTDESRAAIRGVCSVLTLRPQRVACSQNKALFGPDSVAFRDNLAAGSQLTATMLARSTDMAQSVQVVTSREVTLTSRDGKVPVILENTLDQPVTVRLRLEARDRSRLRSITEVTRELKGNQREQLEIQIHAEGPGRFPVMISLHSPSGTPLGEPIQVIIRSTGLGAIAVGITGTALGILVLAVVIRAIRRLLKRRNRDAPPPSAPAASVGIGP